MWLVQRVPFSYVNVYSLPNCFNPLGTFSLLYVLFYGVVYNSNNVISNNGDTQGNVKCTLAQVLRFCTGRTAHRKSKSIALPFLDHGSRRG